MRHIRAFFRRYKPEIIIAVSVGAVSWVGTNVVTLLTQRRDPLMIAVVALAFVVTSLLLVLLFNLKRIVDSRFGRINDIVFELLDFSWGESQYIQRLGHYRFEKRKLAHQLVDQVLPKLVDMAKEQDPPPTRLNLILDSGTTITPVFPDLLLCGIRGFPKDKEHKLRIYTNNLAGVGQIHRMDDVPNAVLRERDFVLVAGQPLRKYRATTGDDTQKFLSTIWNDPDSLRETTVTIAVLTANWFLCGRSLDALSFCARGEGHFAFKKAVFENSNYVVFVAPLGKLLSNDDKRWLNRIIPEAEEEYETYRPPDERKETTYLLTSFRSHRTHSPLVEHSMRLEDIQRNGHAKNYTFWEPVRNYNPKGSKGEIDDLEVPHLYIRRNFEQAYSGLFRL